MEANRALKKRSVSRRREIQERAALAACALLLVAGIVVYFQSRTDTGPAPVSVPAKEARGDLGPKVTPGGTLEPAARDVARTFIRTVLARENLAQAWNLATPKLRGVVTKKQWLKGEIPVAPFPVRSLETTGFNVVGSAPGKILLQVLLVPELDSGYIPTRYDLTLEQRAGKGSWKVSYFLPYAPPGMFAEPG